MSIRIVLIEDHELMREGLRALIEKQPGFEVIGEAGDGRSAMELVQNLMPDVVVMDIGMPELNGIDATRRITSENMQVRVVGLSMHADRRYVVAMLKAGALGYLLKDCAFDELITAIKYVMSGHRYLSPLILDEVLVDYLNSGVISDVSVYSLLSEREREVLQLIADEKSTREIAALLYVSQKTVESYKSRIMEKLNIHTTAGLIKFAIKEGLVRPDSV